VVVVAGRVVVLATGTGTPTSVVVARGSMLAAGAVVSAAVTGASVEGTVGASVEVGVVGNRRVVARRLVVVRFDFFGLLTDFFLLLVVLTLALEAFGFVAAAFADLLRPVVGDDWADAGGTRVAENTARRLTTAAATGEVKRAIAKTYRVEMMVV
jgi:hypothetical protein